MKQFVLLLLCFSLSIFTVARATKPAQTPAPHTKTAPGKSATRKTDAQTLLSNANKALAAMIKAARADKTLDPKTAKNKPFWKSTQLVAKNLKTAKQALGAKNDDFFKGIAEARKAEAQMKVDWQLTDSKNKKVTQNAKILGNAIEALRTNYSKEAARKKQGGELTAKEKAEFEKIKTQQKDLLAKVSKLEKAAQKDKALAKGLNEIRKQAERIARQPATLDAYLATLYLLDLQAGLIRGFEYYVDKPWRTDYLALTDWVTGYDSSYYAWYDTVPYDWAWVDTSVDISEDVVVPESVSDAEISSQESYAETESFDMSDAEEQEVATEEDTDEEVASADDNSLEGPSNDEGEDMDEDDGGAAAGDEDAGADEGGVDEGGYDSGSDDSGSDDSGSDDGGSDDGGGDDGE